MGFIGGHLPELIIVLVVILIIWGPGKLPDIGAGIGKGIREFRKASTENSRHGDGNHHHPGAAGSGRAGRRCACSGPGTARGARDCRGRRDDTPALSFWLTRRSGAR